MRRCKLVCARAEAAKGWARDHSVTVAFVVLFAYITVVGGVGWEIIKKEQNERRHQNCLTFERDQRADIRIHRGEIEDYRELLRYVDDIPAGERHTQLNQAIIRSVPERRADLAALRGEVMSSRPPAYCDKSGVGLESG